MKHAIRASLAGAALIATTLSAQAADMRAPIYKAAPVPAPLAAWTGCYVGGNIGGGWASKSFKDATISTDFGGQTVSGFLGGGQIGCDFQTGLLVFGIQGLYDWTGARSSNVWPAGGSVNTTNIRWFSTLTGRIGFAQTGSMLLYAKGGAAWVGDDHSIQNAAGTVLWNGNTNRSGWTAGLGLEWSFAPNWSAFAEYGYLGFGTRTVNFTPVVPGATFPVSIQQNVNLFLVGINYRFGAPLGTRY